MIKMATNCDREKTVHVSEERFVWLLNQRGYTFTREDKVETKIKKLAVTTRPDFYVETPRNDAFLIEVESFEKPGPLQGMATRVMFSDPELAFKRIRKAVMHAAAQLRPYQGLNLPMLVVLDNWRRVGIPSNILDLRNALFGTLEVRQHFDPVSGKIMGCPKWHHGRGQQLNETLATYVSAVAWNLPRTRYYDDPMTEERPMYLRIVHNPFASVPFPIDIFSNGNDEHYGYKNGCWVNFLAPRCRDTRH
jgi:hypothetical protein